MKKKLDINDLYDFGLSILIFIFLNILFSSTLFFLKINIGYFRSIFSFFITIIVMIILLIKKSKKTSSIITFIGVFCLIIIGSLFISGKTYDLSYDGNNYHKLAIGQLKDGWNPVFQSLDEFVSSDQSIVKSNSGSSVWIDHYAKGYWIFAANLYYVTGNIEVGKCLNLLLIISCSLITFSYLRKKVSIKTAFLISLFISFNPISVTQLFTFYNDCILSTMIPILIVSILYLFEDNIVQKYKKYILYFISIVLLINIKFTGFAYAGITTAVFYIFIIFNSKYRALILKRITVISIVALIIGMFCIGYSTYSKNFIEHKHPFYPLFGDNKVDIITGNQPKSFAEMNRIKKFILANFSESANIYALTNMEPTLKIPFTVRKKELLNLNTYDLRIGGFGVLFGGILIISLITLTISIFIIYKQHKENLHKILLPLISIIILIFLLEDGWWARYLPQLYLIPLITVIVIDKFKTKLAIIMQIILLILIFLNISLFLPFNIVPNVYENILNKNNINDINNSKELFVYTNDFCGSIYNIIDKYENKVIILNEDLINTEKYEKYLVMNDMLNLYIRK